MTLSIRESAQNYYDRILDYECRKGEEFTTGSQVKAKSLRKSIDSTVKKAEPIEPENKITHSPDTLQGSIEIIKNDFANNAYNQISGRIEYKRPTGNLNKTTATYHLAGNSFTSPMKVPHGTPTKDTVYKKLENLFDPYTVKKDGKNFTVSNK